MPDSKWGPEADEETKAAARRLRLYVNAWIAAYGDKGFLPRIGYDSIPSLAVADMARVLADWEGPHGWAVARWQYVCEEQIAAPLETFLYEEDARAALGFFAPDSFVAWWDENGPGSCWVER